MNSPYWKGRNVTLSFKQFFFQSGTKDGQKRKRIPFQIRSEDNFWNWTEKIFIPGIRAARWYNGELPYFQRGFTGDRVGRMMGYAVLRQLRVKPDFCTVDPMFYNIVDACIKPYSFADSDTANYGMEWKPFVWLNKTTNNSAEQFVYRTASELDGYVFVGKISTYQGDGYVHQFRGSADELQKNLAWLKSQHWIDRFTRAVFVEFTVYYPYVNIFGVATMVLELPGTGGMWPSHRFEPASLSKFLSSESKAFEIVCIAAFFICIVIFIVKEVRNIYRQRKAYFFQVWNWCELFIICTSIGSMAAYAFMIIETNQLTDKFRKYQGNTYIKFQFVGYWHEHLAYCTAFIVFVATIKFIKLLRFNKRMGMLGAVLSYSAKDIRQFLIIFFLVFFAFVQIFYLLFKNTLYRYHTFVHSTEASIQIALGKFEFLELYEQSQVLGPLVFACFVIFIIFVMLNMFLAILNDAFERVRADVELQSNEHEMVDFIMRRFLVWTGMNQSSVGRKLFKTEITENEYVEPDARALSQQISTFPDKVTQLISYIDKVYMPGQLPADLRRQREKEAPQERKCFADQTVADIDAVRPRTPAPPAAMRNPQRHPKPQARLPPTGMGSGASVRSEMTPVDDVSTEL